MTAVIDMEKKDTLQYVLRLGDDALILGHRLSEWCRFGPFLEEDIALTNVALDYIGRARMFYGYVAELADDGRTEDDFAYLRDARSYQNLLINELPKGDFAFTTGQCDLEMAQMKVISVCKMHLIRFGVTRLKCLNRMNSKNNL
jgi:phenylacetate-CoA oxygenase PaaI subunit